jgi:ASC-1-like (ASCH) protein
MPIIKKKIWPEFFDLVKSGKKKFEVKISDRRMNLSRLLKTLKLRKLL